MIHFLPTKIPLFATGPVSPWVRWRLYPVSQPQPIALSLYPGGRLWLLAGSHCSYVMEVVRSCARVLTGGDIEVYVLYGGCYYSYGSP